MLPKNKKFAKIKYIKKEKKLMKNEKFLRNGGGRLL